MELSQRLMDSVVPGAYSFDGRLDLGWRALQCVGHYAESIRLMQAACCVASGRCEVVCAFTPVSYTHLTLPTILLV